MVDDRFPKRILSFKPKGRRLLELPRKRFELVEWKTTLNIKKVDDY